MLLLTLLLTAHTYTHAHCCRPAGALIGGRAGRQAMNAFEHIPAHHLSVPGLFGSRKAFTNPWPTWKGDAAYQVSGAWVAAAAGSQHRQAARAWVTLLL